MTDSDHTNEFNADPFEGDNALFSRLKAANPISGSAANDDARAGADTLFEQITSRPAGFAPYAAPEPTVQSTDAPFAGAVSAAARPAGPSADERRGRWGLLAAVAALAVVLIAAVAVVAPGGAEPALAVVQSAAQETADASSGRVITEFDVVGQEDVEEEQVSGALTATFDDDDFAVTVDFDPSSTVMSAAEAAEIGRAETRLVDGQLYVTPDGEQWMSVEAPEILQSTLARLTDLRTVLAQVEELVEVELVGPAEIDGAAVTHYRSEVDLADETLAESGWLPGTQGVQATPVDIDAEGTVTVDLYVDDAGLMRRIDVSGEATPTDESIDASADFTITTNFVDIGSDIVIEAPDPALVETLDFGSEGGLGGLDD